MIILRNNLFSKSEEEKRINKMKGKLLLDDLGTVTGIHPLYRKAKEKITGTKTLYHYTPSKNIESIMENGFDPDYDSVSKRYNKSTGKELETGIYFGNQSKSVPRSTIIDRYRSKQRKLKRGDKIPEGWGDPGVMMTLKIPMSEYNRMKKRESDPMSDENVNFKKLIKENRRFKEEYENSGILDKLSMRSMAGSLDKHAKKDVILMKEKVDPKYITKIDKNWS